ncbi:MAG: Coenzyme F420 hydrogenase/dehydrogenase, beta subunit C-terminal domain [Verrucomicrobia bacterium]|nr:Coenzyme F420 hydrogenase/dehydrogenase, beta subunit C-terminal domain [Verrucomicrobiota bacterium]
MQSSSHIPAPPAVPQGLFEQVVCGGYCIGCGACAVVSPSRFSIEMDEFGCYQAVTLPNPADQAEGDAAGAAVCPFSASAISEDEVAREVFPADARAHDAVGRFLETFAGYVLEDGYRNRGSSGGMVSWMAKELLQRDLVDGIVHAKAGPGSSPLFQYGISRSVEELNRHPKSKYYPVELSSVLRELEQEPGRFAIIALPCFAKALRALFRQQPNLREKIPFIIGLFCGHLKSANYAENYGWQLGIDPGQLTAVDFRVKLSDRSANHYGIKVEGQKNGAAISVTHDHQSLFGANWGFGFFKYSACDYCDDVTAELADISIGDAWIDPYMKDPMGTNIVVIRHPVLRDVIREGISNGHISMDEVTADDVMRSQASGIRHRREGLAYRLYLKQKAGLWVPPKRVRPSRDLSRERRSIYRLRIRLSAESHRAFRQARRAGDYDLFRRQMTPIIERYRDHYARDHFHRLRRRIKRILPRILGERMTRMFVRLWRGGIAPGTS